MSNRWYDPPLTKRGKILAKTTAKKMKESGIIPKIVYSSPMIRTLETAEQIAQEFGVGVKIIYGLSECAAVVKKYGFEKIEFLDYDEIASACPKLKIYGSIDTKPEKFHHSVKRVATDLSEKDNAGEHLIIVTHREGIRSFSKKFTETPIRQTPYCCIAQFKFIRSYKIDMIKSEWFVQNILLDRIVSNDRRKLYKLGPVLLNDEPIMNAVMSEVDREKYDKKSTEINSFVYNER